jgi:hypothetical protein
MTFVLAGCVLFLALLVGIVLDDLGWSPLAELRLDYPLALLPRATGQADDLSEAIYFEDFEDALREPSDVLLPIRSSSRRRALSPLIFRSWTGTVDPSTISPQTSPAGEDGDGCRELAAQSGSGTLRARLPRE